METPMFANFLEVVEANPMNQETLMILQPELKKFKDKIDRAKKPIEKTFEKLSSFAPKTIALDCVNRFTTLIGGLETLLKKHYTSNNSSRIEVLEAIREKIKDLEQVVIELRVYSDDFVIGKLTPSEEQMRVFIQFQIRIERADTAILKQVLCAMGKDNEIQKTILQHLDVSEKLTSTNKSTPRVFMHRRGESTDIKNLAKLIENAERQKHSLINPTDRLWQGTVGFKKVHNRIKQRFVVVTSSSIYIFKKDESSNAILTIALMGSFVRLEKELKFSLFASDSSTYIFSCDKEKDFISLSSIIQKASTSSTMNAITSEPPNQQSSVSKQELLDTITFIQKENGNQLCADCNAPQPQWISINLGIFVCLECSGAHRHLGTHISQIRSAEFDVLTQDQIQFLAQSGNERSNSIFEANLPNQSKPVPSASLEEKTEFIQKKYLNKLFCPETNLPTISSILSLGENSKCVNCKDIVEWMSLRHGITACTSCAAGMNALGLKMKSLKEVFTLDELNHLQNIGNLKFNQIWENNIPSSYKKPTNDSEVEEKVFYVTWKFNQNLETKSRNLSSESVKSSPLKSNSSEKQKLGSIRSKSSNFIPNLFSPNLTK